MHLQKISIILSWKEFSNTLWRNNNFYEGSLEHIVVYLNFVILRIYCDVLCADVCCNITNGMFTFIAGCNEHNGEFAVCHALNHLTDKMQRTQSQKL